MGGYYNIRAVVTCKTDRKGFGSDVLKLDNNCGCGTFVRLWDIILGVVITQWKESIINQTVRTVTKKGGGIMTQQKGDYMVELNFTHDIITYQVNMYGVNRGNQHRVMGADVSNVAHFKNGTIMIHQ